MIFKGSRFDLLYNNGMSSVLIRIDEAILHLTYRWVRDKLDIKCTRFAQGSSLLVFQFTVHACIESLSIISYEPKS